MISEKYLEHLHEELQRVRTEACKLTGENWELIKEGSRSELRARNAEQKATRLEERLRELNVPSH